MLDSLLVCAPSYCWLLRCGGDVGGGAAADGGDAAVQAPGRSRSWSRPAAWPLWSRVDCSCSGLLLGPACLTGPCAW